jgi:hypothetical protein
VKRGTRICIAFVAGLVKRGGRDAGIFDRAEAREYQLSGEIDGSNVEVFDAERRCRFSGSLPTLVDYGTNARVYLDFDDNRFSGYDHASGHRFHGVVTSHSVAFHDDGNALPFIYIL